MSGIANLSCTPAAFAGLGAEILSQGKTLRFRARGSSMQPLVRDGDFVLVRSVDSRLVRVGDVVLCSSEPGHVVVHRVVCRKSGPEGYRFFVQGDQVERPDGWVLPPQLFGRVASLERAGVEIDLNRPVMRFLGWSAALRSRLRFARGRTLSFARHLLVFYRHSA